jgi:signal transduction histidine kinase
VVSISLVLAFSLVFLFIYEKKYEETNKESLIAMSAQTMSYLGADVMRELAPAINVVEAASGILGKVPRESLKEIFKGMLASNPSTYDLYYCSAKSRKEGGFFETANGWNPDEDPDLANWDHVERSWFIDAVQNKGKAIISEYYIDADTKKLIFTVAKTTESSEGEINGVVAEDIFHEVLESIMNARKITEDGESYLLDIYGNYLTGNSKEKTLGTNFFDDFWHDFSREQILSGRDSIFFNKKYYLAVSHLMGTDWFIVSKGSLAALDKSPAFSVLAIMAIVAIIGILWGLTVTASVYEALKSKHAKQILEERKLANTLLSVKRAHYQEMKDMYKTLSILQHDFKLHIKVIDELLQADHIKETKQYLREFKEQMPEGNFNYYCYNHTINALLSSYAKRCNPLGIQYKVSIELPETLPIPDYEVCIILGNLLENAFEACQKAETDRSIELDIKTDPSRLAIKVKNRFDGTIAQKSGKLATTKKNGGLGLLGIQAIAETYEGEIVPKWSETHFTVYVVLNFIVP